VCCSKYQVQMPVAEARQLAETLGIGWEEFKSDYLDDAWPGGRTVLLRHRGGNCVFLEPQPDGKVFFCRVHTFKPKACIEWSAEADKKDCKDGLQKYWNLNVDAQSDIVGEDANVEALEGFLKRLGSMH